MSDRTNNQRIADYLERDLQCDDPDIREEGLDRLGTLAGEHLRRIAEMLADPVPDVRASAVVNLGGLRSPEAWPILLRHLQTEADEEVACHAISALSHFKNDEIFRFHLNVLTDKERDYRLRMHAAMQLWKYQADIAIPALSALEREGDEPLVLLHARDSLTVLRNGMGDVLELVSRQLQHPLAQKRSDALHRLSSLTSAVAVQLAEPLLHDGDVQVRVSCCACLGALRDNRAIPLLLSVLQRESPAAARAAAILGLENYDAPEIGEKLISVLSEGWLDKKEVPLSCRQMWKYPSVHAAKLIRDVLDKSTIPPPQHVAVTSTLSFIDRYLAEQQ